MRCFGVSFEGENPEAEGRGALCANYPEGFFGVK